MSALVETVMERNKHGRWVIPVQEGRNDLPRVFRRRKPILDEYGETVDWERVQIPALISMAVEDWPDHITGPLPVTLQPLGPGTWIVLYEGSRFGKVRGQ